MSVAGFCGILSRVSWMRIREGMTLPPPEQYRAKWQALYFLVGAVMCGSLWEIETPSFLVCFSWAEMVSAKWDLCPLFFIVSCRSGCLFSARDSFNNATARVFYFHYLLVFSEFAACLKKNVSMHR